MSAATDACPHSGDQTRKFGGAIVCDDCSAVVGNWCTDEVVERVVLPAVERNTDGQSWGAADGDR